MKHQSPRGTLHQRTIDLIKESDLTFIQIYEATGISFYWIRKFANGMVPNPSVNRVQELYEFLKGEELKLD